MNLQRLASSTAVLLGAMPTASSAAAPAVALRGTFDEQVLEGKARAFDSPRLVADAIGRHPFLSSQSANDDPCDDEAEALGMCMLNAGIMDIEKIIACVDCYTSTLDPAKHESCDALEEHDWCGALDTCASQKCPSQCAGEFVSAANCLLTEFGCTDYQCSQ